MKVSRISQWTRYSSMFRSLLIERVSRTESYFNWIQSSLYKRFLIRKVLYTKGSLYEMFLIRCIPYTQDFRVWENSCSVAGSSLTDVSTLGSDACGTGFQLHEYRLHNDPSLFERVSTRLSLLLLRNLAKVSDVAMTKIVEAFPLPVSGLHLLPYSRVLTERAITTHNLINIKVGCLYVQGAARYFEQLRTLLTSGRVEISKFCFWWELSLAMSFTGQKFWTRAPCYSGAIHDIPSRWANV